MAILLGLSCGYQGKTLDADLSPPVEPPNATKKEQGQAENNQRLDNLESEVTRIKESVILIENDHGKKLGALLDGYGMLADKVEPLPGAVDALQEDVSVIKAVVTSHSMDINVLKAV